MGLLTFIELKKWSLQVKLSHNTYVFSIKSFFHIGDRRGGGGGGARVGGRHAPCKKKTKIVCNVGGGGFVATFSPYRGLIATFFSLCGALFGLAPPPHRKISVGAHAPTWWKKKQYREKGPRTKGEKYLYKKEKGPHIFVTGEAPIYSVHTPAGAHVWVWHSNIFLSFSIDHSICSFRVQTRWKDFTQYTIFRQGRPQKFS